jgi:hypothetical protein
VLMRMFLIFGLVRVKLPHEDARCAVILNRAGEFSGCCLKRRAQMTTILVFGLVRGKLLYRRRDTRLWFGLTPRRLPRAIDLDHAASPLEGP